MSYEEFTKNIKSGDLILFSGNAWYSKIIEYFTNSKYSHIGIVLQDGEKWWLLESGYESYSSTNKVFGVQLTDLEKIYNENKGYIYIRTLKKNTEIIDLSSTIKKCYENVKNCPYDTDVCDWICALLEIKGDIPELKYERKDKFWCSALTTFVLEKCEIVNSQDYWTLIAPCDYSCKYQKSRIQFINGYSYEDEKLIL